MSNSSLLDVGNKREEAKTESQVSVFILGMVFLSYFVYTYADPSAGWQDSKDFVHPTILMLRLSVSWSSFPCLIMIRSLHIYLFHIDVLLMCMCTMCMQCPWRPGEGVKFPGSGVIMSHHVDAGTRTQLLWKSSQCC